MNGLSNSGLRFCITSGTVIIRNDLNGPAGCSALVHVTPARRKVLHWIVSLLVECSRINGVTSVVYFSNMQCNKTNEKMYTKISANTIFTRLMQSAVRKQTKLPGIFSALMTFTMQHITTISITFALRRCWRIHNALQYILILFMQAAAPWHGQTDWPVTLITDNRSYWQKFLCR